MIPVSPAELYLPDARPMMHCVALVGAGGKTSLMNAMAAHAVAAGETVIRTTTTKLASATPNPVFWDGRSETLDDVAKRLALCRQLLMVRDRDTTTGKLLGLAPEAVDLLTASSLADRIFVEADGARGKSLKAPADHEPVIPSSTDLIIGILGADALGASLDETLVFRPERLAAICDTRPGQTMDAHVLARLAAHPQGLFRNAPPPPCRRILFVNKMDLVDEAAAEMLAQARQLVRAVHPDGPRSAMQWYAGSVNGGWLWPLDRD